MLNISRTVSWNLCSDDLPMVTLRWLQPYTPTYVRLPGSCVQRWRGHGGKESRLLLCEPTLYTTSCSIPELCPTPALSFSAILLPVKMEALERVVPGSCAILLCVLTVAVAIKCIHVTKSAGPRRLGTWRTLLTSAGFIKQWKQWDFLVLFPTTVTYNHLKTKSEIIIFYIHRLYNLGFRVRRAQHLFI